MYVGHFAIGLAIKAHAPRMGALPILLGAGILDVVDGLLIIAGIDRVTPNLSAGPYLFFDLTYVDWDHSLLMAVVLSLAWGAIFLGDRQAAVLAGVAAFLAFFGRYSYAQCGSRFVSERSHAFRVRLVGPIGHRTMVAGRAFQRVSDHLGMESLLEASCECGLASRRDDDFVRTALALVVADEMGCSTPGTADTHPSWFTGQCGLPGPRCTD